MTTLTGTVYPRPHKWAVDKKGRRYKAPLRPGEEWTDPDTGKVTKAGPKGSTWSWSFVTGTRAAGTRRPHTKGGYPTKKAASEALTEAVAAYNAGDDTLLRKPEKVALGDYLNRWLDERAAVPADDDNHIKPTTVQSYRDAIRAWIAPRDDDGRWRPLPRLGGMELDRLSADHLAGLYADLRVRGKRCRRCNGEGRTPCQRPGVDVCPLCEGVGGKPLGSRSVQLAHTALQLALAEAVEAGKLPRSPIERMPKKKRPKHRARQQADRYWTPEEAQRFVTATRNDRLGPLWALFLDTGARRGEICGLTWPDVDLDAGTVTLHANRVLVGTEVIEQDVKGKLKTRTLDLDARTVTLLRTWRAKQAAERLAAGEVWAGGEPGRSGYVWTDELGEPYRPDWVSAAFERAQRGVDVSPLVLHGTRHTMATTALARSVPVHVVSKRLGHADVAITLRVYAHVLDEQASDAARIIGDAFYGPATGTEGG